jgi:hypothetical protein
MRKQKRRGNGWSALVGFLLGIRMDMQRQPLAKEMPERRSINLEDTQYEKMFSIVAESDERQNRLKRLFINTEDTQYEKMFSIVAAYDPAKKIFFILQVSSK